MSRGLGWVQRECLRVIAEYEKTNKRLPTTYNITATVYQIQPDKDGNRWVNDAQHVAIKRALEGLRRKGLATGQQDVRIEPNGEKIFLHVRPGTRYAERCCFWQLKHKIE